MPFFYLFSGFGNTFALSQLMRIATVICFLLLRLFPTHSWLILQLLSLQKQSASPVTSHRYSKLDVTWAMIKQTLRWIIKLQPETWEFSFCVGALGNSDCYGNIYFAGILAQSWLAILESTCFKKQELQALSEALGRVLDWEVSGHLSISLSWTVSISTISSTSKPRGAGYISENWY